MMIVIAIISNIILVAIDQITKYFASQYLKQIDKFVVIDGVFNLTYVENKGAAFGLFQGATFFFVIFTAIVLVGIGYYYVKLPKIKINIWVRVSLILISAGAIGNFIDRLFNGYVVDLFHATFIKFMNFPVFNMADVYVVVGTILLSVLLTFFVKEDELNVDKISKI